MLISLISLLAVNNLASSPALPAPLSAELPLPSVISAYAEKTGPSWQPEISARSVLSLDLDTGKILYQQNPEEKLPMASLTKLMTLLVILDNHALNEIVTVDSRATKIEPAKIYLQPGEKITVGELVKASLIKSANDAALALAYYDSQDLDKFAQKMNGRADSLGMINSHFKNPHGFDDPDQYTTSDDLAILARAIYRKPIIRDYASVSKTSVTSLDEQSYEVENSNQLLGSYLKVFGLKTGTTDLAGQCLISIVESPEGHKILNIMLNSPARFEESKILSQWIFDNYTWL
jgi:D-alanyl-D-alanine carboxypeptidase